MTHRSTARRRVLQTAVAVLTVAGTLAVGSPSALADSPRVTTCLRPDGITVQQFAGVSVSVVLPFAPFGCDTIKAGATWTTGFGWSATKTWEGIPAGYVPVGSAPIQDFVSHLVSARILIDAGTPQEFSVVWPNSPLKLYTDGQYDYASGITLGTIRPLSVGRHTLQRFITLSGETCDGSSANPDLSCAPGGELGYDDPASPLVFNVVR